MRSASQIRQAEVAKDTKRKLNKDRRRIAELDTIIKKLYESLPLGALPMSALILCLQNTKRSRKLLSHLYRMQNRICPLFEEDTDRAEQFLSLAKKYTDFSELTTPMINEFIEKIIVHAPEKIDGDRCRRLRFI